MPLRKHTPEEIIGKLREVEIVLAQGGTTAEACRRIAVSEQTYYLYGRLSLCKLISKRSAGSVANIYPASAGYPERPNGESAHAHLNSW